MGRKAKASNIKQCSVLVKWIEIAVWDVIEAELAFKNNSKLAKEVHANPDCFIGQVLDFVWKEGEEQSPGTLLGYGKYFKSILVQIISGSSGIIIRTSLVNKGKTEMRVINF